MKYNFFNEIKPSAVMSILIISFLLIPVYTGFAQSADNSNKLTFSMVLEEKGSVLDFIIAVEEYEKSLLEQQFYSLSGDTEFGITPAIRSQWTDTTDPPQIDLNLNMEIGFYTGRNPVLEDKYQAALRNTEASRLEMEAALNETVLNLYSLYSAIWLLQQESIILDKEKLLAENKYNGAYEKYIEGVLTFSELEDADEDLQAVETSLQENFLAIRLAWFSFQQYRGKSDNLSDSIIPVFEEFRFEIDDIEKPNVLSEKVIPIDVSIMKLQNSLVSLQDTADRLRNFDLGLSLKPYVGYDDYSANITYVPENRFINISSSIPVASFNSSDSQDSSKKWNAGMTLVLEFDTGKQNRIEKEILDKEIYQQEVFLKKQIDRTIYELRTAYQQFIEARRSLELSEKAYDRQVRLYDAVQVRLDSGQALRSDLLSADISVQRSQWKLASARTILQKSYMTLIVLTGDLPF